MDVQNDPFRDLYLICARDNKEALLAYLNNGGNVNTANNDGDTLLHIAVLHNSQESVRLLLERGADPIVSNTRGNTPLHFATLARNNESLTILLSYMKDARNINIQNKNGCTPLYYACYYGNIDCVKLLLLVCDEIDVNLRNVEGNTPLLITSRFQHSKEIVKDLLNHGADPFILNEDGKIFLDYILDEKVKEEMETHMEELASLDIKEHSP